MTTGTGLVAWAAELQSGVDIRVRSASDEPAAPSGESSAEISDQQMTDAVRKVLDGDEEAARWMVQKLYPLVIKIVRAHRPRRMDEEDLAQMVFVRVFGKLEQWRHQARFEHWVSRVAVNVCLGQLSYHRRRPELRMADLSESQAEVVEQIASDERAPDPRDGLADRELVDKLMATLGPRDRLVLQLLDLERRSVEEVSRITGWGKSMVKVQAFRARLRMRKSLAQLSKEFTLS